MLPYKELRWQKITTEISRSGIVVTPFSPKDCRWLTIEMNDIASLCRCRFEQDFSVFCFCTRVLRYQFLNWKPWMVHTDMHVTSKPERHCVHLHPFFNHTMIHIIQRNFKNLVAFWVNNSQAEGRERWNKICKN